MAVILNKIDPVIVNTVHKQTAEEIVHSSQNVRVSKDKKENKGNNPSNKKMKDKIEKFNSMLEAMDIGMNFIIDGNLISVADKDGIILKKYNEDAIIELFNKMEDMIGVFIDTRK